MDQRRMFELRLKGYCCSQILLQIGIEDAGLNDNPDLIQAVRGLCDGIQGEMLCGIVPAAACLISLVQPADAKLLTADLVEWFKSEYEHDNGGITCRDILAGEALNRLNKCPQILAATYDKTVELLIANGYEYAELPIE